MTIATQISALQQDKTDIATAITNKGGTVNTGDGFDDFAADIATIPSGGGGGDTVYAINHTGSTPSEDDKVILNIGVRASTNNLDYDYSISSEYNPVIFLDTNNFITSFGSSTYQYTLVGNTWERANASSKYGSDFGARTLPFYHSDGIISLDCWYNDGGKNQLVTSSGYRDVVSSGSGRQYLGNYNGIYYTHYGYGNKLYTYNYTNNTDGSTVLDAGYNGKKGFLIGDYGFLWADSAGLVDRFHINNNNSVSWAGSTTVEASLYPLYITGTTEGHYTFVTDNATNNYMNSSSATSTTSHLYIYQVQSNGTIKQVHIPELETFETTPCMVSYDNRSEMLCVGTKDAVFLYQFNSTDFSFSQKLVHFDLNTNNSNYAYYPFMSPDKTKVVIISRTGTGTYNVKAYMLNEEMKDFVTNTSYNYMPDNSFTGFVTGNTDEQGRYEISTVLPSTTWFSVEPDLTPDSVTVYGGVE